MKLRILFVALIISLFTIGSLTPVSAFNEVDSNVFVFESKTEDEIQQQLSDKKPKAGDTALTKVGYQKIKEREAELNNQQVSTRSMNGLEKYVVKSIKTVRPYGFLKSQHLKEIPRGVSETESSSVSMSLGYKFEDWTFGVSTSVGSSVTYSGPGDGYIGSGARITHRLFLGVMSGTIAETTFSVHDYQTGVYLRDHKEFTVLDEDMLVYSTDASITSGDMMYYQSFSKNGIAAVQSFNRYKQLVNGTQGSPYIFFAGMQFFE